MLSTSEKEKKRREMYDFIYEGYEARATNPYGKGVVDMSPRDVHRTSTSLFGAFP